MRSELHSDLVYRVVRVEDAPDVNAGDGRMLRPTSVKFAYSSFVPRSARCIEVTVYGFRVSKRTGVTLRSRTRWDVGIPESALVADASLRWLRDLMEQYRPQASS